MTASSGVKSFLMCVEDGRGGGGGGGERGGRRRRKRDGAYE